MLYGADVGDATVAAAKKSVTETGDYSSLSLLSTDTKEDDDHDYDDDMDTEEDKTVKQTVCDQEVDVTKLVADVEFMVLVDR